jgi:hypothetical protein
LTHDQKRKKEKKKNASFGQYQNPYVGSPTLGWLYRLQKYNLRQRIGDEVRSDWEHSGEHIRNLRNMFEIIENLMGTR